MNIDPSLFDVADDQAERRADARADADVREGRVIPHGAVRRWLASWGTAKVEPRPRIIQTTPASSKAAGPRVPLRAS